MTRKQGNIENNYFFNCRPPTSFFNGTALLFTLMQDTDFEEVIAFPSSLCLDSLESGDPASYSNVPLTCPS